MRRSSKSLIMKRREHPPGTSLRDSLPRRNIRPCNSPSVRPQHSGKDRHNRLKVVDQASLEEDSHLRRVDHRSSASSVPNMVTIPPTARMGKHSLKLAKQQRKDLRLGEWQHRTVNQDTDHATNSIARWMQLQDPVGTLEISRLHQLPHGRTTPRRWSMQSERHSLATGQRSPTAMAPR